MFVHFDKSKQQKPIKIWLGGYRQVEEGCLRQSSTSPTYLLFISGQL